VATVVQAADLPSNGRLAFHRQSGGRFYHVRPDGSLYHSTDLIQWTGEPLPGFTSYSDFALGGMRIVTRTDGARLLGIGHQTWVSAAGSGVWVAGPTFPPSNNGRSALYFATGPRFTVLHPTSRRVVVAPPQSTDILDYRVRTSADGVEWDDLGTLPSAGSYKSSAGDLETVLLVEDRGFDEVSREFTPVRLWRLGAGATLVAVEPLPGMVPSWVAYSAGKWIVQGDTAGTPRLMVSDDSSTWSEAPLATAGQAMIGFEGHGDGRWILRDSTGSFTTTDFQTWTRMPPSPVGPSSSSVSPVWVNGKWVNLNPAGYGPIDHYESIDLSSWKLVSAGWPADDSRVMAVTGGHLVSTLGKGLFAMDERGAWTALSWRKDVVRCIRWQDRWVFASEGGLLGLLDGGTERWQTVLNAPVPSSSSTNEVVIGFIDAGAELFAVSNRSLYASRDGWSWERRPTAANRSVTSFTRLGQRLILETSGGAPNKLLQFSDNGGGTWTDIALPTGSVNYTNGSPSSASGLFTEGDTAFYIASSNLRYGSTDGANWQILPADTQAYLPPPVFLPGGIMEWSYDSSGIRRQWRFVPPPPAAVIPLTPPAPQTSLNRPHHFRGRIINLGASGVEVTPLANLIPVFPDQAGRTVEPGQSFEVAVDLRNSGFDTAWMDDPVRLDFYLSADASAVAGGNMIGSIEFTGALEAGTSSRRQATLTLPRDSAGGRYHLVARLSETGGLAVDAVAADNSAVSAEPLVRIPGNTIRVQATAGGKLSLSRPAAARIALENGALIEREPLALLEAIADPGQRFTGWSDSSLGDSAAIPVESSSTPSLTAYFAAGSGRYDEWEFRTGPADGDSDLDGIPNVLEFLLGTDPSDPGSAGWTLPTSQSGPSVEFSEARGMVSHELILSSSTDLMSWRVIPRDEWILAGEDAAEFRWRVELPIGGRGFIRFSSREASAP
jgi:hypothetical protein